MKNNKSMIHKYEEDFFILINLYLGAYVEKHTPNCDVTITLSAQLIFGLLCSVQITFPTKVYKKKHVCCIYDWAENLINFFQV